MRVQSAVTLVALTTLSSTASAFTVKTPSAAAAAANSASTSQLQMAQNNDESASASASASASTRRSFAQTSAAGLLSMLPILTAKPEPSSARLDPVNNPALLPSDPNQVVIQTEKFLTTGQAKRMSDLITSLENDTGYRLRVLCQSYPNTPGLAIRDYWSLGKEDQKDDKYIVLVVDQFGGKGNVLNFNVGDGIKFALPNVFWTRLSGKYGTTFFVRENGIDIAITNAIEAIVQCLRSEEQYCVNVPDQGISMKSLGL